MEFTHDYTLRIVLAVILAIILFGMSVTKINMHSDKAKNDTNRILEYSEVDKTNP